MSSTDRRVAVITGGSQGIGAGLVAEYRRRGWAVLATSRTIEPEEDPALLTIDGDISEADTIDRIINGALGHFGRIDTLVNNAGLYVSKPFTDYTPDDYVAVVGVNLTGFFMLTQRVIAEMLKRGAGHIVNITTTLADYANSSAPSVLTSLTKGGLASATKSLAIEYASRGIRVNAVSPGIIQTPRRRATPDWARNFPRSATWARSTTSWTEFSFWRRRCSSPARSCTSTGDRSQVIDGPKATSHRWIRCGQDRGCSRLKLRRSSSAFRTASRSRSS